MESTSEQVKSLYPFLHGKRKDEASENVTLLNSVSEKVSASVDVKTKFFEKRSSVDRDCKSNCANLFQKQSSLCDG